MSALIEIEALLAVYFDALHRSDADALAGIFHPRAVYATADESPPLYRTMDDYLPVVAARPSPASRGEGRRDAIEQIQFAGANTALARVRCSIGTRDFTDFLSLLREDGAWKIVAKVFAIRARTEPET